MSASLKLLFRNRLAALGAVVLTAILVLVLRTPFLPLQNPDVTANADRFARPFEKGHLLGADNLGRDILSRLLYGTRLSLGVGFVAALGAAVIGSVIGIVAGISAAAPTTLSCVVSICSWRFPMFCRRWRSWRRLDRGR